MPPFQYDQYAPQHTGTIAQLMGESARIRAANERARGQARGQMIAGIGNTIAGTLGDIITYQDQAPARAAAAQEAALKAEEQQLRIQESRRKQADAEVQKQEDIAAAEYFSTNPQPTLAGLSKVMRPERAAELWKTYKPEKREGFTLTPGQTRFDADGNPIAEVTPLPEPPPKPVAPPNLGSEEDYITRRAAAMGRTPQQVAPPDILKWRAEFAASTRAPKEPPAVDPAKIEDRNALVDAVIANPSLWDQITPTVRGQIAPELSKRGFDGFGKPLTEAANVRIAESSAAIDSLKDLRVVLQKNEQYIGPIAGLSAMNPWSPARRAQADIDLVRQRVGKALEGGVLRKEDEEKYKKILATLTDTPETAIYKIDQLVKQIENDIQTYRNQQRLSGRRVPSESPSPRPADPPSPPALKAAEDILRGR